MMARGKYATRAANTRANSAEMEIADLRVTLADERTAHAREVVELRGRIQQLSGQFTKAVDSAAADDIRRIRDECAAQISEERARQRERAREVSRLLGERDVRLPREDWARLSELLEVPLAEFLKDSGATLRNRTSRRKTTKGYRALESLMDQVDDRGGMPITTTVYRND